MKKVIYLLVLALSFSVLAKTQQKTSPKTDKNTANSEIILTEDNVIVLNDAFEGSTVSELSSKAMQLDAKLASDYPIYLFLDTPGGEIQSGLELFETLNGLNRPVHTITLFAASMGFQAVQHLGNRYILKYGVLMAHKARGGFSGEFGGGLSQLDARYGLWLRRIDLMDQKTVERTSGKHTLESFRSLYSNEMWLNGQEAVDAGFADSVVVVSCDSTMRGSYDKSIDTFFGSVDVTFSKCPLQTYPLAIKENVYTNRGKMPLNEFMGAGGTFGGCERVNDISEYSFKYSSEKNNDILKQTPPCVSNKDITYQSIKDASSSIKAGYQRENKNSIKFSY